MTHDFDRPALCALQLLDPARFLSRSGHFRWIESNHSGVVYDQIVKATERSNFARLMHSNDLTHQRQQRRQGIVRFKTAALDAGPQEIQERIVCFRAHGFFSAVARSSEASALSFSMSLARILSSFETIF